MTRLRGFSKLNNCGMSKKKFIESICHSLKQATDGKRSSSNDIVYATKLFFI